MVGLEVVELVYSCNSGMLFLGSFLGDSAAGELTWLNAEGDADEDIRSNIESGPSLPSSVLTDAGLAS